LGTGQGVLSPLVFLWQLDKHYFDPGTLEQSLEHCSDLLFGRGRSDRYSAFSYVASRFTGSMTRRGLQPGRHIILEATQYASTRPYGSVRGAACEVPCILAILGSQIP